MVVRTGAGNEREYLNTFTKKGEVEPPLLNLFNEECYSISSLPSGIEPVGSAAIVSTISVYEDLSE